MSKGERPLAFWIIVVFLAISIILLLLGQTMSVFQYDFTVSLGLQESADQVSDYGVQVNRAFGAGDTVVYVPLLIASLVGLWLRKRWSLVTTAAAAGVSAYWAVTIAFMMAFLAGVPGYSLQPGLEYYIFLGAFIVFGVWGIFYLIFRGDALLR
ncbi:MAG: hypothetical protein H3C34_16985 [Caldilineaceae bacterium]|nr:hypothetical protein [Caldilineaceae bacterium]